LAVAAGEEGEIRLETHHCVDVTNHAFPDGGGKLSFVIHYHAYYIEGMDALFATFAETFRQCELVVTTDTVQKKIAITKLANEAGISCRVVRMPNRGRDYGPFFALLHRGFFSHADIVGHLHAKRSASISSAAAERWESYLHNMLLKPEGFSAIKSIFHAEPQIGIVYPEDRHCPGWGKNKTFADAMVAEGVAVPDVPSAFPVGSMFYIRKACLEGADRLINFREKGAPLEPVPYDGSSLHALERLWPTLANASGFEFATLFDRDFSR
jgi:lipopolysaccharide biosynthesis protein